MFGASILKQQEIVTYKEAKYTIMYKYESGYYEIKMLDKSYVVELVHKSELKYH